MAGNTKRESPRMAVLGDSKKNEKMRHCEVSPSKSRGTMYENIHGVNKKNILQGDLPLDEKGFQWKTKGQQNLIALDVVDLPDGPASLSPSDTKQMEPL